MTRIYGSAAWPEGKLCHNRGGVNYCQLCRKSIPLHSPIFWKKAQPNAQLKSGWHHIWVCPKCNCLSDDLFRISLDKLLQDGMLYGTHERVGT